MKNKKEALTLFFCDIYGTIDGEITEEDCIKFAYLLEQIRLLNGSDYIYFGMASTENLDIVNLYEERLSKYFTNKIIVLSKDLEIEVLREIKTSYTLKHIQKLLKNYEIKEVYFADDSYFYSEMLKTLLLEYNIKLNSIIPGKDENYLRFINEELENKYLLENNKTML